jgi:hypothetical protein
VIWPSANATWPRRMTNLGQPSSRTRSHPPGPGTRPVRQAPRAPGACAAARLARPPAQHAAADQPARPCCGPGITRRQSENACPGEHPPLSAQRAHAEMSVTPVHISACRTKGVRGATRPHFCRTYTGNSSRSCGTGALARFCATGLIYTLKACIPVNRTMRGVSEHSVAAVCSDGNTGWCYPRLFGGMGCARVTSRQSRVC